MNIYKITREYRTDTRTTWHDSKVTADRIVKRHKRLGNKFMKMMNNLDAKYPPHKREMHLYLAEVYQKELEDLRAGFANEYGERDAPLKYVEVEKRVIKPSRAGLVSLLNGELEEWKNGRNENGKHEGT